MENLATYYVSVIQENRNLLVQDILMDIIEGLKQENVFTEKEVLEIMGKDYVPIENFHYVADKMLDLLMSKPHSDVITFVKLLKNNYEWLYSLFEDDQCYEYLLLGGVPTLPRIMAERKKLLKIVREKLALLKRGHYVVLLGMPGCGKTTLAAHSLRDAKLLKHFDNTVLWVSTNFDDVTSIQNNINVLLREKVELSGDTNIDRARLKNQLSESNCLMILDDVQSASLVEALNIGCKILITARDRTVMKHLEAVTEFIEVDNSFTSDETLSLFTRAIGYNDDISKLPFDAKSIHTLARGFPLSVSLLVGILEDNKESAVQNNSPIWKDLKNLLEKKQYGELIGNGQLNHVISRAVDNLGVHFKEFFNYFALFVEDVNIKQEVFCILWKLNTLDTQDILLHFVKKHLIVRKWAGKNYVYGVHDIILSYLKQSLTQAKIVGLHKELIEKYTEVCDNGDLAKLPQNDNYIFYYIGYHLKAANEMNKLIDLYTNLEFIEAKLKITGPAHLLTDYCKYLHGIEHQADLNKIREINKFIEKCGRDLNMTEKRGLKSTDIVQFILQETHPNSFLYNSALQLASKRSSVAYISFPIGPFSKGNEPSIILHQPAVVTAMKTTNIEDFILLGYNNGSIVLYNAKIRSVIDKYSGHEGGIIKGLALNKNNTYFLSYSHDKRLSIYKLFDFAADDRFNFQELPEPRTPSPVSFQENHSPLWQSKATLSYIHLPHEDVVLCAVYGQEQPTLIASSTQRSLKVWKDNKIYWSKFVENVHSCLFCKNDSIVLAGTTSIIGFSTNNGDNMFDISLPLNLSIQSSVISLLMNPVHFLDNTEDVLVTTQDVISLCSFACNEKECKVFHPVNQYRYYQLADMKKYIAVAYADSEIEIFEKDNASSLGLFHNQKGEVKCISLSNDKLYAAYSDKSVCVWSLNNINNAYDTLPLQPLSIVWVEGSPHIASFSKNHSILVKKERDIIVEIKDVIDVQWKNLGLIKLSEDGKFVAYCHDNYLSRSFLEFPEPHTNIYDLSPSFLNVYMYQNSYLVLANEGAKVLVWNKDKMTFRGQSNIKIQNACYLSGSLVCILDNGSIEEYKVDDASYFRCIHQEDSKSQAYLSEACSGNHVAIVLKKVSGLHALNVFSMLEIVLSEQLPSNCSSIAFSPNGKYLVVLFSSEQSIWLWMDLKGKTKIEIKCPEIINGAIAISNNGTICLRTKEAIYLLEDAYENTSMNWAKALMSCDAPVITASPTNPCLFATVDSCSILHTLSPFHFKKTDVEPLPTSQK